MSHSDKGTLLLIDGFSVAFRAFYALPLDNFHTTTGEPVNAVYGFSSMLSSIVEGRKPTHIAVAFDLPGGTFRTKRYPEYKGTRGETPPEFIPQVPLLRDVLGALGLPVIDKADYEADDIIATYARQAAEAGLDVLIVSGDRDTLQLVTDKVTVLYPRRGVSELDTMTPDAVREKHGVSPEQYPDLAALVGETSDNLPGVPGVGPKTAAKWIETYGGLDGIIEAAPDIPGKAGESLRENLEQVKLNRELNHLVTDLDLPLTIDDLRRTEADADAIHRVCDALQFRSLRPKLLAFSKGADRKAGGGIIVGVMEDEASGATKVELDGAVTEVTALRARSFLYAGADALGVADERGGVWGIDLASLDQDQDRGLGVWLADSGVPKVLHGAKDAWHTLAVRGYELEGIDGDTEIAAYLVQADQGRFDLESVAQRYLGLASGERGQAGELDLGMGPSAAEAAGGRASEVAQLAAELEREVSERGMDPVYRDMELPLIGVLAGMETAGVGVDRSLLEAMSKECLSRAERAEEAAHAAIGGVEVNLASPKQLQEVLFDRLDMPKTKKIKTGYTTDAASLAELYEKKPHPFLEALLAHRDAAKLRQIIEGLISSIGTDGRIHTTFSQTVASTGRLSSKDPNLQNIPIRTEDGHRIREAFVVGQGYETLLTADYSQIEMRIMAHLSGDPALIEAFKAGEDLHRFVGSRVFGVQPEAVTPEMRTKVKAMSYGLAYGLSSYGLARQLGTPVGEAQTLMDDYYARFGAVRDYLASVVKEARKVGYTQTIFGRRRYHPDLISSDHQRRQMAERVALNAPIQGSAADLIKRAMIEIDRRLAAEGLRSRQILQIHDELMVEVAPGERTRVEEILVEEMAGAADLTVPLEVHVGVGATWREAGH
ncbi:MAG: DNA polymerase I [Demequinaceae bacterium]|nr:DNA polymerase I [Demequinaceae bacterium]